VSRNVVVVAASPAAVWKRLVTPAVWWSSDHTFSGDAANLSLDPMPGGCFCERLPGEAVATAKGAKPVHVAPRGGVEHMRVIYAERGKALRMTGALGPLQSEAVQATLTVTLKAVDGGTRIVFEYVVGGYMRYPAEKIVPAIDTVLGNQLLGLAHGFAADQPGTTPPTAENASAADAPAPAAKGLDKRGILLPRGRVWSLPPSDGPVAASPAPTSGPVVAPLPTDAVPQDVTPSGGAKAKARHGKQVRKPVVPEPVAPEPAASNPVVAQPDVAPVAPAAAPDAVAPDTAPVVPKKGAKTAHKKPVKPVTPPKSDEPSTDAVNSAFDNAVGDPQRQVPNAQ
jgi:hypothetical protein